MNKKTNTREFREDKVVRGSSNLFVSKTKSIVAFKIKKFTSSVKDSAFLLNFVPSISLLLFSRVDRSV